MIHMDITQVDAFITLTGAPVPIEGWSEASDCLGFADAVELTAFKKGADGKMIAHNNGEKGGEVSIKVLANSPFVDVMSAYIELLKAGVQVPAQLTVTNKEVGDVVQCFNGVLKTHPMAPAYGKGDVGEMSYVWEFERTVFAPIGSKRGNFLATVTGGIA